ILQDIKKAATDTTEGLELALKDVPKKFEFKRVYIPTLRGLRSLEGKDHYAQRTKTDYFSNTQRVEIFTGLTLYEEIRKLLLGTLAERKTVAEFQEFLSNAFFERKPVALIPKYDRDVLDVKIGDEAQRPIFELGDGVQAVIILTFPLFQY